MWCRKQNFQEIRLQSLWGLWPTKATCDNRRKTKMKRLRLIWPSFESQNNVLVKDAVGEKIATGDMSATHPRLQGTFKTIPGHFVSKVCRRVVTPCHVRLSCPELREHNYLENQTRAIQDWYFTSKNHFGAPHCRFLGFFFFDHFSIK